MAYSWSVKDMLCAAFQYGFSVYYFNCFNTVTIKGKFFRSFLKDDNTVKCMYIFY